MKLVDSVELIHSKVSYETVILIDSNDEEFKTALGRWSDINWRFQVR